MIRFRSIQFVGRRLVSLYHHSQHLSLLTIALRGLPFFRGFRHFNINDSIGIKVISLNDFTLGLLSTLQYSVLMT